MPNDEQQIRDLIATWHTASAKAEWGVLVPLMAADVVFLLPGQPPMRGREAFLAAVRNVQRGQIEARATVQEIQIAGNLAYCWTQLSVTMAQRRGHQSETRSGHTLSIFRKSPDGSWVLFRDANMLAPDPPANE